MFSYIQEMRNQFHLYFTISTALHVLTFKFSPVNDFRGFIQATVGYNARNRTFSNFVTYGTNSVTEWGLEN